MIKHWHPHRPTTERAERLAAHYSVRLDLGPGQFPFRTSTIRAGRHTDNDFDFSRDTFPWDDNEIGFAYSRHTLEDLDDPVHFLSEINRVARAGWIETPSPMSELCRGVDAGCGDGESPWRGYHHHRSICWSEDGVLHVTPKYACYLEHLPLNEAELNRILRRPEAWNNCHPWEGELKFQYHQHEVDFTIGPEYVNLIERAIRAALERE